VRRQTKDDMTMRWVARYFSLAEHVARWSKDPSTKVGAVVVGADRRMIALGYNGFPPGIADTDDRLENRVVKHHLVQHAERNVLDNAQFDLRGATLVVTHHPCAECAKSIVSKGIAHVVCGPSLTHEPWATSAILAKSILNEAGVKLMVFVVP
jgi:dCMP deaminase